LRHTLVKGHTVYLQHNGKVAFIGHPAEMNMFRAYIRHLKPDKTYRDELLIKLFEWTPSYKVTEWQNLSFDGVSYFDAMLLMVPFLPEMRDIKLKKIVDKIDSALAIAVENGCSVAALGAFTSIVLQGQEQDFSQKHEIRLTSGNSLTACVIVRSVEEAAAQFGIDIGKATLGIIGASGDIGSACVSYFGNKVNKMVLTARSLGSLAALQETRKNDIECEVDIFTDNTYAVQQADIIIFVTSAYVPMYSQTDFRPGTIVCDASAPQNVIMTGTPRKDAFIYHGGIVSLPFNLDTGFDLGLAAPNTFYGCQVEGILQVLDSSLPCSWGRGNITREKMDIFLKKLDSCQNLNVSFSTGKHLYLKEDLNRYKKYFSQLAKYEGVAK
jgi:predicted amino acid dehydrogenase